MLAFLPELLRARAEEHPGRGVGGKGASGSASSGEQLDGVWAGEQLCSALHSGWERDNTLMAGTWGALGAAVGFSCAAVSHLGQEGVEGEAVL